MKSRAHKNQINKFLSIKYLALLTFIMAVIAMIAVLAFVLIRGLPFLNMQLLFGDYSKAPSIKPALIGTTYLVLISISLAAPIGIGCAVFLTEYMKSKSKYIIFIRITIETLAGIPSIVYGIFGYLVFVVALRLRYSILGGGITLAIMILPVIVRSTEESLLAVPVSLREGSYALGTSKVKTIFTIVLPCAMSGIVTSLILAIGRVMSESAVLILTIGMVVNKIPQGITSAGTSLALDVYYFGSHGYPEEAAATGVVLLILVVSINILATVLGKKLGKGELSDG